MGTRDMEVLFDENELRNGVPDEHPFGCCSV